MSYHHTHDHNHQERFCPACENGAYGAGGGGYGGGYGGSSPRDYSRNTVRAIAAEKKRVQRRKKEVLALKQKIDSLDREQLELYHTILQNERLAALDTLRHCAQEANADIQAAKDKLAEVEQTNANKGYFGVAHLKEDVEAANKSVYRLRSEVTAASAELLEVIALEDNEPIPEPEPVSPVKSLRISKRGDIDITFDQPEPSGYTSLVNTPQPMPRFNHSQQRPYSMSVRSAPPQLKNSYRPSPVYHHYDRGSFNRTPVTDRLMMSSPRMRTLLPAHRQSRATLNPAGSVGYNVHEASNVSCRVMPVVRLYTRTHSLLVLQLKQSLRLLPCASYRQLLQRVSLGPATATLGRTLGGGCTQRSRKAAPVGFPTSWIETHRQTSPTLLASHSLTHARPPARTHIHSHKGSWEIW